MTSSESQDGEGSAVVGNQDAWKLYCSIFAEMFPRARVELSPVVIAEFAERISSARSERRDTPGTDAAVTITPDDVAMHAGFLVVTSAAVRKALLGTAPLAPNHDGAKLPCHKCGADRAKEPCKARQPLDCAMHGEALAANRHPTEP